MTEPILNAFTGEMLDADDLPALKAALQEIEAFLAEKRRENGKVYDARDRIQERVVELEPITLPRPSRQTDKQRKIERCPRCRSVIELSAASPATPEDGPQAVPQQPSSLPPESPAEQQPKSKKAVV